MEIDKIKEKLAIEISQSTEWETKLEDSSPGHYGIIESDVSVHPENLYVHIPDRKYTFKNVKFDFTLQMLASNKEDGMPQNFSKMAKGEGTFEFANGGKDIVIKDIEIELDLDLYGD